MQGTAPIYETNGELKNERPEVLMNKYKILKEIRDREVRFSDEVDHRPVRGAEAQAASQPGCYTSLKYLSGVKKQ